MAGRWDDIIKRLLRHDPQQLVSWLLEDAVFEAELSVEIKRRDIYADALYKILLNEQPILLEVEIQSTNKKLMPERLLEYNIQASRANKHLPVLTCIIYLFDDGETPVPPYVKTLPNGYEVLRFNYIRIELWKLSTEEILQKGLVGLYPLLPLTANGKNLAVVDTMIEEIAPTGDKDLLTLAYTLAGLVFHDPEDQKKIKRSFAMLGDHILEKSWAYQEIKQEGRAEGVKQGLESLRKVLIGAVQAHYPAQVALATRKAHEINDPEILQAVILQLLTARHEDDVQHILLSIESATE
jgi:predicted transposase YdaD